MTEIHPIKEAQASFQEIDSIAYANRPDEGEAAIIVDGSMYSPSTRACPYAEFVYQNGTDDDWEIFQDELDQLVEAYAHGGYSLGWEDGCLWLYSPGYMPEEIGTDPLCHPLHWRNPDTLACEHPEHDA